MSLNNKVAALCGHFVYIEDVLEHRAGIEPANTGFADQRVSHFATGAHSASYFTLFARGKKQRSSYCGCCVVRRYGFTVL